MMNLICAGEFRPNDGMMLAVWGFDILKYVAPGLQLVLVGDGPQRDRIERFARSLGADDYRIQFWTDVRPEAALERAGIVWSTQSCGSTAILKTALDRGLPTISVARADFGHWPGLISVPANDPVALAIATRKVLATLAPPRGGGVELPNANDEANAVCSGMC